MYRTVVVGKAIDKLPLHARDVRWSLLYRKLKGERGCSCLFPQEYESLRQLLRSANPEGPVAGPNEPNGLTWVDGEIRVEKGIPRSIYKGSQVSPFSHINLRAAEMHLQAWFTWYIAREPSIEPISGNPNWFANEVFVGSGMQKLDILCIISPDSEREFRLIELKFRESVPEELEQFRRYVRWVKSYVWKEGDKIQPIWVSKGLQELGEAKNRARKIANEEGCKELQIYKWALAGQRPSFYSLF